MPRRPLLLSLLLLLALAPSARAAPSAAARVAHESVAALIADLGNLSPAVRKAATRRLDRLPRREVLDIAAGLARSPAPARLDADHALAPAALALDLLDRWHDPRTAALAEGAFSAGDPDLRDCAAGVMAARYTPQSTLFLTRALLVWGQHDSVGMRTVLSALQDPRRAATPAVREAVARFLATPLPPADPRFHYASPHDPPQDGDARRLWEYKADGCLFLVEHHPFPAARPGVMRCLDIPVLRVEAAAALTGLGGGDAVAALRGRLAGERNAERKLALYRALFVLGGDRPGDAQQARTLFVTTTAPSPAWIQGLGAMVALFQARRDAPAMGVVSSWKLTGEAARMRSEAMDAMRRAHPRLYARLATGYRREKTPPQ